MWCWYRVGEKRGRRRGRGKGCRSFYVVVSDRAEEADKFKEGLIVSSKGKE